MDRQTKIALAAALTGAVVGLVLGNVFHSGVFGIVGGVLVAAKAMTIWTKQAHYR